MWYVINKLNQTFLIDCIIFTAPPKVASLSIEITPSEDNTIVNELTEGAILKANAVYSGGFQGKSLFQWLRKKKIGKKEIIEEIQGFYNLYHYDHISFLYKQTIEACTPNLELSVDEIDSFVGVRFTPIRNDKEVGQPATIFLQEVIAACMIMII